MEQQVTQILQNHFQGMTCDLYQLPGSRVSGRIVWSGFEEQDQADRQHAVREWLKQELGAEVQQVGVLLTYTPDELEAMQAA